MFDILLCFITESFFPFSFQAQAVTLTVAQAFKVALDLWEIAQEGEFTELNEGDMTQFSEVQVRKGCDPSNLHPICNLFIVEMNVCV